MAMVAPLMKTGVLAIWAYMLLVPKHRESLFAFDSYENDDTAVAADGRGARRVPAAAAAASAFLLARWRGVGLSIVLGHAGRGAGLRDRCCGPINTRVRLDAARRANSSKGRRSAAYPARLRLSDRADRARYRHRFLAGRRLITYPQRQPVSAGHGVPVARRLDFLRTVRIPHGQRVLWRAIRD